MLWAPYIAGWIASGCEIRLAVGWAKPELTKGLSNVGVSLNFTVTELTWTVSPNSRWEMGLRNCSIDIYSYYGLPTTRIEFAGDGNVASIVNADWTTALDYAGNVVMPVSAALDQPIGIDVDLGMSGIAALTSFVKNEPLPQFVETVAENNHHRENLTSLISSVPPIPKIPCCFQAEPECGIQLRVDINYSKRHSNT